MYLSKLNSIFSLLGGLFGSFCFWLFFVPSVGCSLRRSKCQARKGKFLFPALSCFDNFFFKNSGKQLSQFFAKK